MHLFGLCEFLIWLVFSLFYSGILFLSKKQRKTFFQFSLLTC